MANFSCRVPSLFSGRRLLGWIGGLVFLYACVPFPPVRLFSFLFLLWLGLRTLRGLQGYLFFLGILAYCFFASFLFTPMAAFLYTNGPPDIHRPLAYVIQIILVFVGVIWLLLATVEMRFIRLRRFLPNPVFSIGWIILFSIVYVPSLLADIAYAGDEGYHCISVRIIQLLFWNLLSVPGVFWAILVWLGIGIWLWRAGKVVTSINNTTFRFGKILCFSWAITGLILAAVVAPWQYPDVLLRHDFLQTRISRYPAVQPWISVLLGAFCLENGAFSCSYFSNSMYRFLPFLSMGCLGLILFGNDVRWHNVSFWLRWLAVLAFMTVPTLLYYGTILYLELAMLPLLFLILTDADIWLTGRAIQIRNRPLWPALLVLVFLKETGIFFAALFILARVVVQCKHRYFSDASTTAKNFDALGNWLKQESMLVAAILIPGIVYSYIRHLYSVRPYSLHIDSLFSSTLWMKSWGALLTQFGLIWGLGLLGIGLFIHRRNWRLLGFYLWVFAAYWAFFFLEDPVWIGLARFYLLLLPIVFVFAWNAIAWLFQKSTFLSIGSLCLILFANLWMSPVNIQGQRGEWGYNHDRWYPFSKCFQDLQRDFPNARIIIGNMPLDFSAYLVSWPLGWNAEIGTMKPFSNKEPLENIYLTLQRAAMYRIHAVIIRDTGNVSLPDQIEVNGFRMVRRYPAREGGLLVFYRTAVPSLGLPDSVK